MKFYLPLATALLGLIGCGATSNEPVSYDLGVRPDFRQIDRESYSHVSENDYHRVETEPLSTFSIDVDTASYSNVRRFLRDGELPPADAVRVEELINYFRYATPDLAGEHPFAVDAEIGPCPWAEGRLLARIHLASPEIDLKEAPPANLVFLLDVSGSMHDAAKLPLLQRSFALLTEQLRPQDRVAIVVYAGASGVVLPSTPGSEKDEILAAIKRLQAGGSTAGAAGIRLAYETARENFIPGGANRVILATDGDFNVGVSSEGELVRLIEQERESGVFLTVMGFGWGNLQDAKVEQLADHGNGQYLYIDSLLEARRALVGQLGGTLFTVAKDVKLQVEFNPAVIAAYRLVGYENRLLAARDFDDDAKDAGELGAGHEVTALYELIPAGAKDDAAGEPIPLKYQQTRLRPKAADGAEAFQVKVRYKLPDENQSRLFAIPVRAETPELAQRSDSFRFAAAVAEFGLLLRDSEHRGSANWEQAVELAESARSTDPDGRRAELVYLTRTAQSLAADR